MRTFSSYGPINTKQHFYVPRTALIEQAKAELLGQDPSDNGHYITVWGPRQTGKTWIMHEVLFRLQTLSEFDVAKLNLQHLRDATMIEAVQAITEEIAIAIQKELPRPENLADFEKIFSRAFLNKPLLLIMDEFDNLSEDAINGAVSVLRNIYIRRQQQGHLLTADRDYLLHGVALIGVRAVLGVENSTGSPFNVQRSLQIPNLTETEVTQLFQWYSKESGQQVIPEAVERLFYETNGQPGLVGWFGELLTKTYNKESDVPITLENFQAVYGSALQLLPNNNILNIISKAKQQPYRQQVLDLFKTGVQVPFAYEDPVINFLYTNGVIDVVQENGDSYNVRFASPFVQRRLFNYFAREIFPTPGILHDPFDDLDDTITDTSLNVKNLVRRYEQYLQTNGSWLFKNAPRRKTDGRIYEAVYHFNFYTYLLQFLHSYDATVTPEFPTGNGKVDLLIDHANQLYGIEVKSFLNQREYHKGLVQAARYAKQLQITEIALVLFVDHVDDANRKKFEVDYKDQKSGVTVTPLLVATGT